MLTLVPELIEQYACQHTQPVSALLQQLEVETYATTQIPQMLVGHLEGAFLSLLVKLTGACRILEIGTFTGYSALAMAEALPDDGQLITCDIDSESVAIGQKYWTQSPHGHKIKVHLGQALESIQALDGLFDMVFVDADKTNYIRYWEACVPKVRIGGLLVADNVLWSGRVLNPQAESDHALVRFNQHVSADQRVQAVMLPIRDGITLAVKL